MRKILFFLGFFSATLVAAELPMVIDPVVNATPPGAKVTAGYFTLMNGTDKSITITSIYSPTIEIIEIHLSSVKDDVASMAKQDEVSVDAGGTLEFAHGSYHLMLIGLTEPLKVNDIVDVILTTNIGDMLIEMPVKKPGAHKAADNQGDLKKSSKVGMTNGKYPTMKESEHGNMKKDGAEHTEETKNVN